MNTKLYNEPSIDIEIFIKNIIDNIYDKFYNFLKKIIDNNKFKFLYNDKNLNNTLRLNNENIINLNNNNTNKLTELVQRWCWHQYNSHDSIHIVIPYIENGNYIYDRVIEDISYIINDENFKNNLNSIYFDKFKNFKDEIINYLNTKYDEYNENYKNKENNEKKINLNIENEIYIFTYNNERNEIYQLRILKNIYDKLFNNLSITDNELSYKLTYERKNEIIFCLYLRYEYLDSNNQQIAIIKDIKDIFKEIKYNNKSFNFELFGSAINTYTNKYCSLFYDIEKYFGSQGNFFNYKIEDGFYWCNPPYDEIIMENTTTQIIDSIKKNNNLIFLVSIPIWDKITQISLNNLEKKQIYSELGFKKKLYNKLVNDKCKNHFDDYKAYRNLIPYIQQQLIIPKNRIPYYNYKKNKYIYAVNSYLLLIHSDNIDISYNEVLDKINSCFYIILENDKNNIYNNKKKKKF